jgi:hypothetical protein
MKKGNWFLIDGQARRIKPGITLEYLQGKYPHKKIKKIKAPPCIETLERWMSDGGCKSIDGCWIEPDGECEHGEPSWLLVLGMI